MRAWARRTAELHDELAAIADTDARWWLLAGGAAATEHRTPRASYVVSDADPSADTFIGYAAAHPADPFADAIVRARAARQALRELDGTLPDQPLAVTIDRSADTSIAVSSLDVAAFAVGDRVLVHRLDDAQLVDRLRRLEPTTSKDVPFVCVSIGSDPIDVARHAHRRAWTGRGGPWLGLGHTEEIATVSTCHLAVDGYGHARITARIAELTASLATNGSHRSLPPLLPVRGAIPLGIAWRPLPQPIPRAIPMAYALGMVLHRRASISTNARASNVGNGRSNGHANGHFSRFSPTFQIPVAPGDRNDPTRWRRRVVPALASVRFDADDNPERFDLFEARVRDAFARESQGRGLCSRLLAAVRAAPAPLSWKRKSVGPSRSRWLDRFADVIGGRACLSRIHLDAPLPPACAVSSPARLATANDPFGGCVITILDDGTHAAITACGSGSLAGTTADANALLDELLSLV